MQRNTPPIPFRFEFDLPATVEPSTVAAVLRAESYDWPAAKAEVLTRREGTLVSFRQLDKRNGHRRDAAVSLADQQPSEGTNRYVVTGETAGYSYFNGDRAARRLFHEVNAAIRLNTGVRPVMVEQSEAPGIA